MKQFCIVTVALLVVQIALAQNHKSSIQTSNITHPKLIVGIVVDQMRWDFLYRYSARYSANGFKRLLREGFTCENAFIPYTPTVTAAGHTSIYTGSVPAIDGIVGNNWWDKQEQRSVYCSEDKSVKTVGGPNGCKNDEW